MEEKEVAKDSEACKTNEKASNEKEPEELDLNKSIKKKLEKKDEEIESLKYEVNHWKNQYYKAYADMANLRKDIEKDHQNVIKYRVEGLVDNLLGVLDSFDMAFKVKATTKEMENFLKGFEYVHSNLLKVLEDEGVNVINPAIGSKFDEKTMHAVETVEDDGEENIVKDVYLKGYKLYDHLIRPANVKVSKHKAIDKKEEKEATK